MNPLTSEMYEGSGDAWGIVAIISWLLLLAAMSKLFDFFDVDIEKQLSIGMAAHAALPLLFLYSGIMHEREIWECIASTLGISVMAWFSFAISSSYMTQADDERQARKKWKDADK